MNGQSGAPPETVVPDSPPVARSVFGERLPLAEAFAGALAGRGITRGLLGPREVPRLWDRHLVNSAVVAPALHSGERVIDVGSGAGLPGIALAIARPDVEFTLLEPLLRRVQFLEEVIAELALGNTSVQRGRAEDVGARRGEWNVAVARAVAPLGRLAGWALPLLAAGGRLLAWKGERAEEELGRFRGERGFSHVASAAIRQYGGELMEQPTTVVEIVIGAAGRERARGDAS